MPATIHHPRLRQLEVQRVTHAGHPYFLLSDPQKIAEGELLVPQHLGPVLALCDGTLAPEAIGDAVRRTHGLPLQDIHVTALLNALDEAAMLDNGTYAQRRAQTLAAWRASEFRPMALAGTGYPASARALARALNGYLSMAADVAPAEVSWAHGVGLLSPHIDYPRGGEVYARIWKRAKQAAREAEVAVVFGTDHHGDDPVSLTRLPYATPYGTLPLDLPVVDAADQAVAAVLGEGAAFAGELRHRREHSLELVLTWLHHMRGGAPLPVAPILVGGFHHFLRESRGPARDALVQGLLAAVQRATAGRRTLFVASGDLAHVGSAFEGDPLTESALAAVTSDDSHLLRQLEMGDADGAFAEIRRVADGNNVCGTAPIYYTLRAVAGVNAHSPLNGAHSSSAGAVEGETMDYAVCPADMTETSVVTVAGVLFCGVGREFRQG